MTFDEFYTKYYGYVRALCYSVYVPNDPANSIDDIIQTVFLIAWQHYVELDTQNTFGWLKHVARQRISAARYYSMNRGRNKLKYLSEPLFDGDDTYSELSELIHDEKIDDIDAEIRNTELFEEVLGRDKEIIDMYMSGYNYTEIGKAFKLNVQWISKIVQRIAFNVLDKVA